MSNADPPYVQLLERYCLAVFTKKLDALMALYADDITVFDPFNDWSIHGIAAWRASMQQWFDGMGEGRVGVRYTKPHATIVQYSLVLHTTLSFFEFDAHAKQVRSIANRCTMAARRDMDDWQIFHQHCSLPVAAASLQAITQPATPLVFA